MGTMGRAAMWWLALALVAIPAVGAEAPDEPGKKEEAVPKLDGVWQGFTVEGKGETPDRGPVHLELTIKGDHVDAKRLDGQQLPMKEGTYKIAAGKPMQMDGTETNARGRARAYLGICELNGDTLKWCVSTPNNPRPTEFETKRPSFLVILKRQKPQN
jgi:uncharacterized protein (TIGR03067 family)